MENLTRRRLIQSLAGAALTPVAMAANARLQQPTTASVPDAVPYSSAVLPPGIRSRFVKNINGLRMHVLEAGFEVKGRPAVVLLHGFPELAYSWRKVMLPIASAGYHVIAPDLRGYGRTAAPTSRYDEDLGPVPHAQHGQGHRRAGVCVRLPLGRRRDRARLRLAARGMVHGRAARRIPLCGDDERTLWRPSGAAVQHRRCAAGRARRRRAGDRIYDELAALKPPRKHYQRYYSTREANDNMWHAPQGVHAFLRAYYHMKSADWKQNKPYPLEAQDGQRVGEAAALLRDGAGQGNG